MAKVLISMREDFLGLIDEIADNEHRTRSELIRQALRSYIKRKDAPELTSADILNSILLD